MSRKQQCIQLGRNKSPQNIKNTSRSKLPQPSTQRDSHPPFQDQQYMNSSLKIAINNDLNRISQTHSQFHPYSPRNISQVIIKQNINPSKSVLQQSPLKRVIVTKPVVLLEQSSPIKTLNQHTSMPYCRQSNQGQNQNQLMRKIKVLQNRIQQLHQQKQANCVKYQEQIKQISSENLYLKSKIIQNDQRFIRQIQNLRKQTVNARNLGVHQRIEHIQVTPKPATIPQIADKHQQKSEAQSLSKHLKNNAYCEDSSIDGVQDDTHHKNDLQQQLTIELENNIMEWSEKTRQMEIIIREQEDQNQALKKQIQAMRQSVFDCTSQIQQNNIHIISSYEEKIKLLLGQKQETLSSNRELMERYQFSKAQNEFYVQSLCQKSQKLMKVEEKCQYLNSKLKELEKLNKESIQSFEEKIKVLEEKQRERVSVTITSNSSNRQALEKEECTKQCPQVSSCNSDQTKPKSFLQNCMIEND